MKESVFRDCTAEERRIIEEMPKRMEAELALVNDLFAPYLFYRSEKGGRRLWSSCCGREGVFWPLLQEIMTKDTYEVSCAKHNDAVHCPFCGRAVTIKCMGKIGRGAALHAYKPVVFLRSRGSALYAQAYFARKHYDARGDCTDCLSKRPEYSFVAAYRFVQGSAMQITMGDYEGHYHCDYEQKNLGGKKHVSEPFLAGWGIGAHYERYQVIGAKALGGTFARYSQYKAWRHVYEGNRCGYLGNSHSGLIAYLTAYAVYPRQVEMLVKMGLCEPVNDLVFARKKNAKILDWKQTDPRKAFSLSGQELKMLLAADGGRFQALEYRHDLMRAGERVTLAQLLAPPGDGKLPELLRKVQITGEYKRLFQLCKACGLLPSKLCRYLEKFTGQRCYGGYFGLQQAWTLWKDTMTMAQQLGFALTDSAVSMPSNLEGKHQEYLEILNQRERIAAANNDRAAHKKAGKRRVELDKRYGFQLDGLLVRAPLDAQEIQAEGRCLSHCVGGYAYRHEEGTDTILFLRQTEAPSVPFCTIEMQGNTIVQIHGYKNEGIHGQGGRFAPDPREVHREFLDTWLAWLKAGSKRDKQGTPRLPKARASA